MAGGSAYKSHLRLCPENPTCATEWRREDHASARRDADRGIARVAQVPRSPPAPPARPGTPPLHETHGVRSRETREISVPSDRTDPGRLRSQTDFWGNAKDPIRVIRVVRGSSESDRVPVLSGGPGSSTSRAIRAGQRVGPCYPWQNPNGQRPKPGPAGHAQSGTSTILSTVFGHSSLESPESNDTSWVVRRWCGGARVNAVGPGPGPCGPARRRRACTAPGLDVPEVLLRVPRHQEARSRPQHREARRPVLDRRPLDRLGESRRDAGDRHDAAARGDRAADRRRTHGDGGVDPRVR